MLEVELNKEEATLLYEIKLLSEQRRLIKLVVDAKTGQVIGEKKRPKRLNKKEHHANPPH